MTKEQLWAEVVTKVVAAVVKTEGGDSRPEMKDVVGLADAVVVHWLQRFGAVITVNLSGENVELQVGNLKMEHRLALLERLNSLPTQSQDSEKPSQTSPTASEDSEESWTKNDNPLQVLPENFE